MLGLGYATLIPTAANVTMSVADVDGMQIAGLIFDAGPTNSPVLLQVGSTSGPDLDHSADQTAIQDVTFRIGGRDGYGL